MHLDRSILEIPSLVVALAMLVGVFAQVIARHVNVPGVVLLLGAGVFLGPDFANVIRPQALGSGLEGVVGVAVAVILFEGGLNLNLRVLRKHKDPIQRLVLVGSVITSLGAAAFTHVLLGWDIRRSFLFGTLVIVTGPTVITPILRRIHLRQNIEAILEAEGIFIDAVGATISVVALDVLLAPPNERWSVAIFGVVRRFGLGTVCGAVGGGAFSLLLRFRNALPEGLANIAALATAIAIYQISNALIPESGIVAVIVAAMVIGHTQSHDLGDLRNFKEQLTILLVAMIFVLLSADVRLADVRLLGWPGVAAVLCISLVVRPLNVFVSTIGTGVALREKLFLSWLAPRGIVAAAVSALFAERMLGAGIEGGAALRALVFLVIGTTVVVQGMSAGLVARLLGVARPKDVGYVLLGAGEIARLLGRSLREGGEDVVFIETNADSARIVEEAGFKVVFGDGLDERALLKARVDSRRACIGATPNESVNLLFVRRVHRHTRSVGTYVSIDADKDDGVSAKMVEENRSQILFASARDLGSHKPGSRNAARLQRWVAKAVGKADGPTLDGLPEGDAIPLTLSRDGKVRPLARPYVAREGDGVDVAIRVDTAEASATWLSDHGWTAAAPSPP